jgi:hypothetical protein
MKKSDFYEKTVQMSINANKEKKERNFALIRERIKQESMCGHFDLIENMYFENIEKYSKEGFRIECANLDLPNERLLYSCRISWGDE